jgi:large subunit ribosomal protein L28e
MTHSADLVWLVSGKTNKYYQLRNNIRLSNDPFNNSGKYTKNHCGFAAEKTAVVKVKNEKQLYITVKDGDAKKAQFPRKMYTKTVFPVGTKASVVAKAVGAVRPNLADIAFRRARKLTGLIKNQKAVRAASKALSAKKTFKRKAVKPTKK